MPVYDYKCRQHGLFNELAAMENAANPAPCPTCGAMSGRVILVPPQIRDMAPDKRAAMDRNERARHEPQISTSSSRAAAREEARHVHHSGCGCSSSGKEQSALRQQVVLLPDGSKVFPSQRPWMISH